MIHRILLKIFRKKFREITKISPEEEMSLYLLNDPEKTLRLIKSLTTCQVMRAFETEDEKERLMAKGAANILKIIKDCHIEAAEINEIGNEEKKIEHWYKFRRNNRTN